LHHGQAQLVLELPDALTGGAQELPGLGVLSVLLEQLKGPGRVVDGAAPLLGQAGGRRELAEGSPGGGLAVAVADHRGI